MNIEMSRRSFLKAAAGAAAAGGLAVTGLGGVAQGAQAAKAQQNGAVWVWQFDRDALADQVREALSQRSLGVIVKTHDGLDWMAKWDRSVHAIWGPEQVAWLARFFSERNVAFHAWCVPKGIDPVAEAIACSIVIEAGAESVYLDLEPGDGTNFWTGSRDAALRFGEELRRLQPKAHIVVAPDARPWQAAKVPLDEFVAFSDEIAPQAYWRTFDTPANHTRMAQHGYPVGPAGVTPELIVNMTVDIFSRFGKPVSPIGQGNAPAEEWQRFLSTLIQRQGVKASVWRYGTSDPSVWDLIGQTLQTARAQQAPPSAPPPQQPAPQALSVPAEPPAQPAQPDAPSPPQPADAQPPATQASEAPAEPDFVRPVLDRLRRLLSIVFLRTP